MEKNDCFLAQKLKRSLHFYTIFPKDCPFEIFQNKWVLSKIQHIILITFFYYKESTQCYRNP